MGEDMDAAGAGWLSWRAAAVAVLAWLALHVAARVADALWWRPRRLEAHFAAQGVRGPPYRFLLGSVKEMVGLMAEASSKPMSPPTSHNALPRVLAFYHYWRKIYGPNFLIWFGPTPRLTVAEPELVREIFLTRAEAFDRYEAHPVVRQLEGDGLVSLHGDKWALHRRVLADAFYPDNLKRLVPHVGRSVAALAEKWRAMASASSSGEVEVDVAEWFQAVTEEAITRATFGRSYDDGRVVFAMQGRLMAYASEAFRKVLVPGYRFLPTKKNWQSWKLDREIRRSLTRLIARRSDEAEAEEEEMGSHSGGFRDLLGAMINAGERKTPPAGAIPVADMLEECKTFFFAGKQTTTNLLAWATVLLAMHPEWQERARREVLDVLGPDELPSKEHLPRLKTVGMIINETLRLYPPAVATIRRAKTDVQLSNGCLIPRDTELLIPIMAIHHDARLWGADAAQFNPARFAGGAARAAKHPLAFIPFGLGARACIGQNLARLEAQLTVAVLLQRFEIRASPNYVHAPTVLMLLYPQYGAPVIFRPRRPARPAAAS
ncbi:cytochrome P450 734A2 [Zea mays]|uniref:Cytochrome P450 734A1 n=1 Tax=Zea mays TaxID=4577 RepID=A0A1D6QQY7_MAIZE|nr:cytochrome P450 734A2 [Zea mays]AQK59916.1 Cytochrome P450 734A1 [Zea mays]|eukprot:XP_008679863.1 cytochrome P450 734A2 [Zea mays]